MAKVTEEDLRLNIIVNGDKAQKELITLENNTSKLNQTNKELRQEKNKLIAAGKKNSDAYKRLTAEIKQNNTAITQNKARMEVLRNQVGVTGLSFNQLNKRAKDLRMQINSMTPANPSRTKLKAELKQIDAQMLKLGMRAKKTKMSLSGMANGFNQYFGMIGMFAASFTGVVMGFRKLVDVANNFEERVDNLSAITGLAGEQLDWLSNKAKETSIDTVEGNIKIKQSADSIVDAYTKVGSQRPELLKNKEALHAVTLDAIILSEAAKTELEPAVKGLTMAMNQLGLESDQSRRIINVMAAGSKEGSADIPYLTSAFEKSGTTARLMNIEVEQLTGAIEAIGPSYSEASMAGNSFDKVLLKMKANQIGYKDGQFDLIRAVEELEQRYASGESAADLFGQEHAKMGELLVLNKEDIIRYTDAVTGTEIALEQATKNTNNNAASLAQAQNRFQLVAITLGEKLAPALTFSTNGFSYLMKAMMIGIEVWKEYKSILVPTLAVLAAYTLAENISVVADKLKTLWTNRVSKAIGGLNKVIRNNPWGIAIVAVGVLVAVLKKLSNQTKESAVNSSAYAGQLHEEKKKMKSLFEVAKKYEKGTVERKEAIDKLKKAYPDYLYNLDSENASTNDLNKALALANKELENKYALMAMGDDKAEAFDKSNEKRMEAYYNLLDRIDENTDSPELAAKLKDDLDMILENSEEVGLSLDSAIKRAKVHGATLADALGVTPGVITSNLTAVVVANSEYNETIETITRAYSKYATTTSNVITGQTTELEKLNMQIAQLKKTQLQFDEGTDSYNKIQETLDLFIKKRIELEEELNKKPVVAGDKDADDDSKASDNLLKAFEQLQFDIAALQMSSDGKQMASIQKKYDDMETAAKGNAEQLAIINRMRDMEESSMMQQWEKRDLAADKKGNDDKKNALEKSVIELNKLLKDQSGAHLAISKEEYQELVKFAKEHYEEDIPELVANLQAEIDKLKDPVEDPTDLFGMTAEDWENFQERIKSAVAALHGIEQIWGAFNDYKAAQEAAEMQRFERNQTQRQQLLQKQFDKGVISQEAYKAKSQAIDEETDKKKRKLAYDQAKRDRNAAIFSIILSTAMAIMGMIASMPGPAGWIMAAAALVTGGIELATVMTEPLPELATGNVQEVMGKSGKKYKADIGTGSGLFSQPTLHNNNKIVGEVDPELVFSGPDTKKILNTPELLAAINYTIGVPEYATGNYSAPSTTADEPSLASEILRLNNHLDNGIVARLLANDQYLDAHNDAQQRYDNLRNDTKM